MPEYAPDHAGLETIPLNDCLRLLASVPIGRIGFQAEGELIVLPVNHAVDGQNVVFRTAVGSKLSAAESENVVTFEADDYDARRRTGWSVVVTGHAEIVYDDAELEALERLGLEPWATAVERSFWVRIRPTSVSGRMIPGRDAARVSPLPLPGVLNVLSGDASHIRPTPFGTVGTVFSGAGIELVWVSKLGEAIEEHWFSSHDEDVILVVQGQLKFEFEAPGEADRVLGVGDVLVLPPDTRCRAYRWPRYAEEPTIFVAAYPAGRAA
jgi:nitroimidazol reductase NimA-like FMN-containing flavoprotein (pyridoxamine 5'-phosphate oxidase superfamily)